MKERSLLASYCCQDDIFWVKDIGQIILVAEAQHRAFFLRGLEEAIWNCLILGHGQRQTQRQISLLLNVTDLVAEETLLRILDSWVGMGILRKDWV